MNGLFFVYVFFVCRHLVHDFKIRHAYNFESFHSGAQLLIAILGLQTQVDLYKKKKVEC